MGGASCGRASTPTGGDRGLAVAGAPCWRYGHTTSSARGVHGPHLPEHGRALLELPTGSDPGECTARGDCRRHVQPCSKWGRCGGTDRADRGDPTLPSLCDGGGRRFPPGVACTARSGAGGGGGLWLGAPPVGPGGVLRHG